MTEDEYINDRLINQLNWYSKKSQYNQKYHKSLKIIEIVSASIIPFVAGMNENIPYSNWILGISGILIAVITAISALCKFQENWIQYRTISETLKHEKYLYLTKVYPYDSSSSFDLLVKRVESLISKENTQWVKYVKKNSIKKENT